MVVPKLEQMLSQIGAVSFGEEKYYNLLELFEQLKEIGDGKVEVSDAILTPFYVETGKRMELYAFELTIEVSAIPNSIERYLQQRTGYADLSVLDPSLISRLRHCYLGVTADTSHLTGETLAQYCAYLFSSEELQEDINGIFDPAKLYFSYWDNAENEFK